MSTLPPREHSRVLAIQRAPSPRLSSNGPLPVRASNSMPGPHWDFASLPILRRGGIQAKLIDNRQHDPLEKEADYVAERAMAPATELTAANFRPPAIAGRFGPSATSVSDPPIATSSGGQPLDRQTRSFMESRLGFDFGHVRIHADSTAGEAARGQGALAFTAGRDVHFGVGQYAPNTPSGRRLIAHELAHVVQQSGRAGPSAASVQRKEVVFPFEIRGPGDWMTADRENDTERWHQSCLVNLNAVDSAQYQRVVERRDFYKWFYDYAADRGFDTRWALAAYVVANGAHQIADMDEDHSISNSLFVMANVELQGAMREGNQVIFDNVLPKLKKLIDGGPLKGPAALKWDMQVLAEEQTLVQQMYKRLAPETIDQLNHIARKKRLAWLGAKLTRGDHVKGGAHVREGTIPAFDEPNIRNVGDRWTYGMKLGDEFTPGGTGFDPIRDHMPAVSESYSSGAEFAKVDVRPALHELDAWLNPNRDDRVGPGSDLGAIIGRLTEADKEHVLQDQSPDGWAYSYAFGQFSFIDDATIRGALPASPADAAAVSGFLARVHTARAAVPVTPPIPIYY